MSLPAKDYNMFGIDAIAGLVNTVVDKIWPDANIDANSKADAIKEQLTLELQSAMGQLEINKAEASNPSLFVSGWRPMVGWICALGFGYQFLFRPIFAGFLLIFGVTPVFPTIEIESLNTLLFGLLGLGTMRSVEKVTNVARTK